MTPSRRGFLTGMLGLVAAPAIVRVASLMPVKTLPALEQAFFADKMIFPLPYRQEFIRAFDRRVQEVVQQLVTRPDGQVGVEMRYANGKVDFIPMS